MNNKLYHLQNNTTKQHTKDCSTLTNSSSTTLVFFLNILGKFRHFHKDTVITNIYNYKCFYNNFILDHSFNRWHIITIHTNYFKCLTNRK